MEIEYIEEDRSKQNKAVFWGFVFMIVGAVVGLIIK
jgi:hypothetical protein